MIVFLIGMPGSGKSTLGKALSDKLGWRFLDTDQEIQEKQGMTIAEIFKTKGEKYFRQLETELLEQLKGSELVVSTGGGMPIFHGNLEKMKEKGITVFIEVSVNALISRLKEEDERPLLEGDKNERLTLLNENRLPKYRQADVVINGEEPDVLTRIIQSIKS